MAEFASASPWELEITDLEDMAEKHEVWYLEIKHAEEKGYVKFSITNLRGEYTWGDIKIMRDMMERYAHCVIYDYSRKTLSCFIFGSNNIPLPEAECLESLNVTLDIYYQFNESGIMLSCNIRSVYKLLTNGQEPKMKRMRERAVGQVFVCPHDVVLGRAWCQRKNINTKVRGAIPPGHVGMIRGLSDLMRAGLEVVPDTIDEDFTDEIELVMWSKVEDMVLKENQSNAQLVIMPCYLGAKNTAIDY